MTSKEEQWCEVNLLMRWRIKCGGSIQETCHKFITSNIAEVHNCLHWNINISGLWCIQLAYELSSLFPRSSSPAYSAKWNSAHVQLAVSKSGCFVVVRANPLLKPKLLLIAVNDKTRQAVQLSSPLFGEPSLFRSMISIVSCKRFVCLLFQNQV